MLFESGLPESEQKFYCEARQKVRQQEKARDKAAERRERDDLWIEHLANGFLDLGDMDPSTFHLISNAQLAVAAEVELSQAERLRKDAYWLARDQAETVRLRGLNGRTPDQERDLAKRLGETAYERDLRIALNALTSLEAAALRKSKKLKIKDKPYSARQARLVEDACLMENYLRRVTEGGKMPSHVRETGRVTRDGRVLRHQSAADRFDLGGAGWQGEAGWVGGSSTQDNGGTCYQDARVEKGKRSATSVMVQRFLNNVAKAPGKRRKGISDKDVIQRIIYLWNDLGWKPKDIARDVGERVMRVKGVIHSAENECRHWAGDNNDVRTVHLKKWAGLDQIHGTLRTDCREIIRGDKDEVFESIAEFMEFINALPVRPQQAVWVRDDLHPERVTKPHLLWYLPADKGVWYDDPLGMAMFEGAAAALTVMAGCDVGGLANLSDCKQATSPRCDFVDLETEHLPDLSELCDRLGVDLKNNLVVTMRSQTTQQMIDSGISDSQSQAFFTMSLKRGWEICDLWRGARELRVNADLDRRLLAFEIQEVLLVDRFMLGELNALRGAKRGAAENTIRVAAKSVAESYGKGRRANGRGYDLQAAKAETKKAVEAVRAGDHDGLTTAEIKKLEISAAQGAGGEYSRRVRLGRGARRVADAMLELSKVGVPDEDAVQKLTSMDIRTVRKHWPAAVALNAANAIVTVIMDAPPTPLESESNSEATRAAASAKCSDVWGVPGEDSGEEQPSSPAGETSGAAGSHPVETLTLETVIPATNLPHVKALRSWNPASGSPQTSRALLEFCRPGVRLYRSSLGIREQERLRQKGRPAGSGKSGQIQDDVEVWPEALPA
ncbi:hypothetical protein BF49_4517 [Bradyrhizobium sp.]|nr:hypothetical protein BF49_4517 [Bradyrhizobium sp.]